MTSFRNSPGAGTVHIKYGRKKARRVWAFLTRRHAEAEPILSGKHPDCESESSRADGQAERAGASLSVATSDEARA